MQLQCKLFTVFQQTIMRNVLNLFYHNVTVEENYFFYFFLRENR